MSPRPLPHINRPLRFPTPPLPNFFPCAATFHFHPTPPPVAPPFALFSHDTLNQAEINADGAFTVSFLFSEGYQDNSDIGETIDVKLLASLEGVYLQCVQMQKCVRLLHMCM